MSFIKKEDANILIDTIDSENIEVKGQEMNPLTSYNITSSAEIYTGVVQPKPETEVEMYMENKISATQPSTKKMRTDEAKKKIAERIDNKIREIYKNHADLPSFTGSVVADCGILAKIADASLEVSIRGVNGAIQTASIWQRLPENTFTWNMAIEPGQNPVTWMRGDITPDVGDTQGFSAMLVMCNRYTDTTTVSLTELQRQRVAEHQANKKDIISFVNARNWFMDGSAIQSWNLMLSQFENGAMRLSTQLPWLKFWLYVREACDIPLFGSTMDNVVIKDIWTKWADYRWRAAEPEQDQFPYLTMRTGHRIRTRTRAVYLSFYLFTEWLRGGARIPGWHGGAGLRDVLPSDIGSSVFVIPVADTSMSLGGEMLYTLAHLPYPIMGCDDSKGGFFTAQTVVEDLNSACGIGQFSQFVMTGDNIGRYYQAGQGGIGEEFTEIFIMFVHQPISVTSAAERFLNIPLSFDTPDVHDIDLAPYWGLVPYAIEEAFNALDMSYGTGRTCQEMFEASIALTYATPAPKALLNNGTLAVFTGNAYWEHNAGVFQHPGEDRAWWRQSNEGQRFDYIGTQLNAFGSSITWFPYPTNYADKRISLHVSPFNSIAAVSLAFNFCKWNQAQMLTSFRVQLRDCLLPHELARMLHCRWQLAMGNFGMGMLTRRVQNPDPIREATRRKLVCGNSGMNDGSVRSRLEQLWGARVQLDMQSGWNDPTEFDWAYVCNDLPGDTERWHYANFRAPLFDWFEICNIDITNTRQKRLWYTPIDEQFRINMNGNAVPVLKDFPDFWTQEWGKLWQDWWVANPYANEFFNTPVNPFTYVVGQSASQFVSPFYLAFQRTIGGALWYMMRVCSGIQNNKSAFHPANKLCMPIIRQSVYWPNMSMMRPAMRVPVRDETMLADTVLRSTESTVHRDFEFYMNEVDPEAFLHTLQ